MTEAETRLLRLAQGRIHNAEMCLYNAWVMLQDDGRGLEPGNKRVARKAIDEAKTIITEAMADLLAACPREKP